MIKTPSDNNSEAVKVSSVTLTNLIISYIKSGKERSTWWMLLYASHQLKLYPFFVHEGERFVAIGKVCEY